MTARKKATVAGARRVTASLDRLASLFEGNARALGIPSRVAADFAHRCDILSDAIDRHVGVRKSAARFNPASIGKTVSGPLEQFDGDEPWMDGQFTQSWFGDLEDKQTSGELAANAEQHVSDSKLASLLRSTSRAAADAATRSVLAKLAEDEGGDKEEAGEEAEEKPEDADKEAKKAARAFGLFVGR